MKERSEKAAEIYQNSQIRIQTENERRGREQTDEGKARYEKEFYTKLDPDEYVIFLHKEGEINTFNNEEKVEQTVVEVLLQKIKLWWKNL
jgi:23S rRNA pseudoU1915 N3-methylase RlmH